MQGSFIYNNKEILLIPGESFSKNQLKSRLHEMEVDFNNNEKKNNIMWKNIIKIFIMNIIDQK